MNGLTYSFHSYNIKIDCMAFQFIASDSWYPPDSLQYDQLICDIFAGKLFSWKNF